MAEKIERQQANKIKRFYKKVDSWKKGVFLQMSVTWDFSVGHCRPVAWSYEKLLKLKLLDKSLLHFC